LAAKHNGFKIQKERVDSRPDVQDKQCVVCGKVDQYMARFADWAENEKWGENILHTPPPHAGLYLGCFVWGDQS